MSSLNPPHDDDNASQSSSSSSTSSSSSSVDEFLTSTGGGGIGGTTPQDREALVRKKLLESFYGASATASSAGKGGSKDTNNAHNTHGGDKSTSKGASGANHYPTTTDTTRSNDNDDDNDDANNSSLNTTIPSLTNITTITTSPSTPYKSPTSIPLPFTATPSDLDSPHFHPPSHTLSHIAHSSTHTLLETDERLALDIRTLDSTMQTLVYENYSKFIDATDAIRSIGTNVTGVSSGETGGKGESGTSGNNGNSGTSGESGNSGLRGLDRLQLAMERIQSASLRSESLLRASREAVAEKLRIQRLLTRLDALLCLPNTLREYIARGKMRMAVQAHRNATEILGRHSAGFESLRSIEAECGGILRGLVGDLRGKLVWWSGCASGRGMKELKGVVEEDELLALAEDPPASPQSVAEIFECAGTLLMLYPTSFSPGLDRKQCQSLALLACGKFLKERLDPLHSEGTVGAGLSSAPTSPGDGTDILVPNDKSSANSNQENENQDGLVSQLPLSFLDGLLESTTLYGVSFQDLDGSSPDDKEQNLLGNFVTENFDRFIAHVRLLLVRHSESFLVNPVSSPKTSTDATLQRDSDDLDDLEDDANFMEVSLALSHLLRSVRELASGLALPEVGLDVSLASTLVDQTVELTEMLVRRRVAMKFGGLRVVVVKDCLAPLVMEVVQSSGSGNATNEEKTNGDNDQDGESSNQPASSSLVEMIQLSSTALSDGLQMADDLIRATLQRSQTEGSSSGLTAPVDSAVVKLAVQKNARMLGIWLASSLEQLIGYEPSEDNILLEFEDDDDEERKNKRKKISLPALEQDENDGISDHRSSLLRRDSSEDSRKDRAALLLSKLINQLDNEASDQAYSNFLLSICEMCRLAERSIANTLNQSIKSALDGDSRTAESANTLFASTINPHRKGKDVLDADNVLAQRFQLAASRALSMYTMNRGAYAASELCANMYKLSDARDPYAIPNAPREECLKLFELIKASCVDCVSIVGGDLFIEPVSPFPDEDQYADVFGTRLTQRSSGMGSTGAAAPRGLQLDVERMFIEKIQVYPHSMEQIDFNRNSIVSGILRIALSSFLEGVRSYVFSSLGYRQMKVDAILLRYLLPHFVKDEFGTPDASACECLFNTIDDIMNKAGERCVDPEVVGDDEYYDTEKDEIVTPYWILQQFLLTNYGSKDQDGVIHGEESVLRRITFS